MELIFALFYLSGPLKSVFDFYQINFPVDFTIITAVFLLFSLVIKYRNEKISLVHERVNLYAFVFLILFYLWMAVSLIYTPSEHYAYVKTMNFAPNLIAFLFPMLSKNFRIDRFTRIITVAVSGLSVFFIFLFIRYYVPGVKSELYDSIGGLYLVCATLLGINTLILACSNHRIFKNLYVNIFFILFSISLMFVLGARGPLIFVILILIVFYAWQLIKFIFRGVIKKDMYKVFLAFFGFFVVASVVFMVFDNEIIYLVKRALMRLNLLVPAKSGGNMGNSVNIRVNQFDLSVQLIFSNLNDFFFGHGIGSFGLLEKGYDHRSYPHNIFLEILVELGFVGFIIFVLFLIQVFRKNGKGIKYVSMFVLFYLILNSMKSSSFIDIRAYFAVFGMYMLKQNSANFTSDSHNTNGQQV